MPSARFSLSRPQIGALIATLGILSAMLAGILFASAGTSPYIQDDVFIHLAIARNLAESGTWGITSGAFSSASSSPLWVLILALGYLIAGELAFYLPLIINIVAICALVLVMQRILADFGIQGIRSWIILGIVALVTPLGPFAFGGMEHPLHMLAVLLFAYALGRVLASDAPKLREYVPLMILAPLVTALRYEGVFVIATACGLLLLRRRFLPLLLIALLGASPLLAFGLWSLAQGGSFVPNTLLIKKNLSLSLSESLRGLAAAAYLNIKTPLFMLFSTTLLGSLYYRIRKDGIPWRIETVALALAAGVFMLQAVFGRFSWVPMFRYEAYLILLGTLFLCICLRDVPFKTLLPRRFFSYGMVVFAILLLLLASPLLRRAISWPHAFLNAYDLYRITYQDSRFLNMHYPNAAAGAIDIGMVSYYGRAQGVRIVDLWGLASADVAQARAAGSYDADTMRSIASREEIEVAILFDSWLKSTIPEDWPKVATWQIQDNATIGSDTVSFYAPTCAQAVILEENMRVFAPSLPAGTEVTMLPWKLNTSCSEREVDR